jgi:hypothetical protein
MDRDRRIEMEVTVAAEIAKGMLSENERCIGRPRRYEEEIPRGAACLAHEIVDAVLRNNLGQDE